MSGPAAGKVTFDISLSLDGFMTAANRRPEEPMGDGGLRLVEWAFGDDERDRAILTDAIASVGAVIAGLFENLGATHIAVEPLAAIQTPRATHLRLRIAR